jgi:ERF superfamily
MKVYSAIVKVMADIGKAGISKDRNNQQQGYKFRGIDDVYNALSPYLASAGLVILPRVLAREVTERATKSGGALFYVVLDVEFDFVAAEDGSKHTVRVAGEAMDSGDKATNKAMSAAYKYACMEAFCIPTEGNPDADSETHEVRGLDPRGELGKAVPLDRARQVAIDMLAIIDQPAPDGDHDNLTACKEALKYHEKVLNPDEDLYIAVGNELPAAKKNVWKAMISAAKKSNSETPARKF